MTLEREIARRAPRWHRDAACRDADPEIFFDRSSTTRKIALRFCDLCIVTDQCLADALEHEDIKGGCHGIRGGLGRREREALVKARTKADTASVAQFAAERLAPDIARWCSFGRVHRAYETWATTEGLDPIGVRRFGVALSEAGIRTAFAARREVIIPATRLIDP